MGLPRQDLGSSAPEGFQDAPQPEHIHSKNPGQPLPRCGGRRKIPQSSESCLIWGFQRTSQPDRSDIQTHFDHWISLNSLSLWPSLRLPGWREDAVAPWKSSLPSWQLPEHPASCRWKLVSYYRPSIQKFCPQGQRRHRPSPQWRS